MRCLKKLTENKGETISEVLVATLIAAVSMLIFAGMVMASQNIVKSSRETIKDYYSRNSMMEVRGTEVKEYSGGKIVFSRSPVYEKSQYDSSDGVKLYSNEKNESSDEYKMIIYSY